MNEKTQTRDIREYIERMRRLKILVIGDLMLDQFIWGKVNRISPEAPVPVVQVTKDSAYPGGAANVARNLADFGISVGISGIIGRDLSGKDLRKLLNASNIATDGLFDLADFPTIVKTRIIARHQQVVRVDRETSLRLQPQQQAKIVAKLRTLIAAVDAVIIEDYGKGFITQSLVDAIFETARHNDVIVAVDPNANNPLNWSGATLVKPNRAEAYIAANRSYDENEKNMIEIGNLLQKKWQIPFLLVTLGEAGMILFHPPHAPLFTPTKAKEVFDVSGAGDTAIAFFTAALSAGLSGAEASEIANHAAGVVVGKLGTATLTPEELLEAFRDE